jgi:hypothetical protein
LELEPIPYWKPRACILKLEDPRIVEKFVDSRRTHVIKNKLLERIKSLQQLLSTDDYNKKESHNEAQAIDSIRLMRILAADHSCRKLPMGTISWTLQLSKILYHIRYYKMVCASVSGTRAINARTLLKTRRLAKIEYPITDLVQAETLLDQAFCEFNTYKHNHNNLRQSFIEELATAKAI